MIAGGYNAGASVVRLANHEALRGYLNLSLGHQFGPETPKL